jgi:hypothetical protein
MDMERSWPPPRTILSLSKRSAGEKRGRVVVSPSSPWKNSREPRASGLRTRSRREERFDAVASGATSNAEIVRNALGAQRVRAAPGRLLRCRSSTMLRHRLRRGRLASGPAALRTRPVRVFPRAAKPRSRRIAALALLPPSPLAVATKRFGVVGRLRRTGRPAAAELVSLGDIRMRTNTEVNHAN